MKLITRYLYVLPLLILLGCYPKLYTPHEVNTQREAGSVSVAILSVAKWEDYVTKLQPTFNLSAKDALKEVVPTTAILEEKFVTTVQAALKISNAGIGKSGTGTMSAPMEDTTDDATATEESESTEKQDTGPSVQELEFQENIGKDRKAADLGPKESILVLKNIQTEDKANIDPMLKYLAATALYQEVKMLDNYLKDAAKSKNYEAYVVRLQISLMPFARNEPYDVFTNLSFFTKVPSYIDCRNRMLKILNSDEITDIGYLEVVQLLLNQKKFPGLTEKQIKEKLEESKLSKAVSTFCPEEFYSDPNKNLDFSSGNAEIVPLLVTDNLEAMLRSRSVNSISQFAAAAFVMTKGFGFLGDVQRRAERLQTVLGQDLNSLLTVAKLSQNTLRVRLGAMQQVGAKFAIVPRTHNVTVLLLVPKNNYKYPDKYDFIKLEVDKIIEKQLGKYPKLLDIVSNTNFYHTSKGVPLKDIRDPDKYDTKKVEQLVEVMYDVARKVVPIPVLNEKQQNELREEIRQAFVPLFMTVKTNNFEGFENFIRANSHNHCGKCGEYAADNNVWDYIIDENLTSILWSEILTASLGYSIDYTYFWLPVIKNSIFFCQKPVVKP